GAHEDVLGFGQPVGHLKRLGWRLGRILGPRRRRQAQHRHGGARPEYFHREAPGMRVRMFHDTSRIITEKKGRGAEGGGRVGEEGPPFSPPLPPPPPPPSPFKDGAAPPCPCGLGAAGYGQKRQSRQPTADSR